MAFLERLKSGQPRCSFSVFNTLAATGDPVILVDGYSSRQAGSAQSSYNRELSERRAQHMVDLLVVRGIPSEKIIRDPGWGNQSHPSSGSSSVDPVLIAGQVPNDHSAEAEWQNGQNPNYSPDFFQLATANLLNPTTTTETYRGTLHRDPMPSTPAAPHLPSPPVPQGQHPDFLRHIGGTVRFERDIIPVAAELRLTVTSKLRTKKAWKSSTTTSTNTAWIGRAGGTKPTTRTLPIRMTVVECRLGFTTIKHRWLHRDVGSQGRRK